MHMTEHLRWQYQLDGAAAPWSIAFMREFPVKIAFRETHRFATEPHVRFQWNFHQKIANFSPITMVVEPFKSDAAFILYDFRINAVSLPVHRIILSSFMGPTTFRSSWKIVFFVNANGSSENYYWLWSGNSELWREWIDAPLWQRDGGNTKSKKKMWSEYEWKGERASERGTACECMCEHRAEWVQRSKASEPKWWTFSFGAGRQVKEISVWEW